MSEWREIPGYEGLYLISDSGDIVALPKPVMCGKKLVHRKAKPIKQTVRGTSKNEKKNFPYPCVSLTNGKQRKIHSIHRLVAEAFIPNPNNLPEVNHKDENPFNNSVGNLEWCTHQYNIEYSKNKAVIQLKNGLVVGRHSSITHASENTGIGRQNINNALRKRSASAGGYQWKYCNE